MESGATYREREQRRAAAWKRGLGEDLPPAPFITQAGRPRGRYEWCLPPEHAALNLLPDVRDRALGLFAELGIPWHAGIDGGPGNHLLSSQVQCVNALAEMVDDPARVRRAFGGAGGVVDVAEVLEVEEGRHLTFEYIGPEDFFGEAPHGPRVRGARCTSVDAAFRYRTEAGTTELALVEWKYTESYLDVRRPEPGKDRTRLARYGADLDDPDGPIDRAELAVEVLFDEPLYQLVRQQLLAHRLETAGVADVVRVLHVLSPDNDDYQRSLVREETRELGATVDEVWRRLLRRPDRFVKVGPAVFLDPDVTSDDYVARYG